MTNHLTNVILGFRIASLALGIPALFIFLFSGIAFLGLYFRAAPNSTHSTGPASLIDFIVTGARMMGTVFDFFSEVAMIASAGVAAVSLVLLTLFVAMFYTGRALDSHQPWARIAGIVLVSILLLISLGGMVVLGRTVGFAAILACGYALWVLGWHY